MFELVKAENRCSACQTTKVPLHCHERWLYRDKWRVAELVGFAILCVRCHAAIHADFAAGKGKFDAALAQIRQVNRITAAEAKEFYKRACRIVIKRNRKRWRVSVSSSLLEEYAQLLILQVTPVRSATADSSLSLFGP